MQGALSDNPDFSRVIKSPALKIHEASAVLGEVLNGLKTGNELKGLAQTICENRRQFALAEVLNQFNELVDNHNGVVNAEVVSAIKLKSDQVKQVESTISDAVGGDVRYRIL